MKKVLAFDFGASSGRALLGMSQDNGSAPELIEIHRFPNEPVRVNGHFYWDILRLFHEIKTGLAKCVAAGHSDVSSIGIDTWGVDYGLLDKNGELIGNPYHYRDARTVGMPAEIAKRFEIGFLYGETGIQSWEYNTLYQLSSAELPGTADKLLFTPDLLAYFLTGEKRRERTIFSTSQLMSAHTGELSDAICEGLNIRKDLFCPVIEPGQAYGLLLPEIAAEAGLPQIPVTAVASHDTASAFAAIPQRENCAYISCGTWSLLGLKLDKPILTPQAEAALFTNEAGDGCVLFLKNIPGAWLAQECRRMWAAAGGDVSFDALAVETAAAADFPGIIDPEDGSFTAPSDMTAAIREYCVKTGQTPPNKSGEYLTLINRSLAATYKKSIDALEEITGSKIDSIHMVGGGINDKMLCKLTEEITGRKVTTGQSEATAMGNVMVQLSSGNRE